MQDRAEEGEDLSALKGSNNKFTNILPRSGPRAEHKSPECQGHPFTKRHGIHVFQGLITAEHFIKHFIYTLSHVIGTCISLPLPHKHIHTLKLTKSFQQVYEAISNMIPI